MHYITAFEFPYISFNHPQILQTLHEEVNADKKVELIEKMER